MNKEERKNLAMDYFTQGYNCSQAVVLSYTDKIGLPEEILAKMALSFGAGMGRLREACGAFTGMIMVLGLLEGYEGPGDKLVKGAHYTKVQKLAEEYTKRNGSIVCRELLGLSVQKQGPIPQDRTPEYYKKRPCRELVGEAVDIFEDYLAGILEQ